MKQGIHPEYAETTISCVCGNVIQTKSTKKEISRELISTKKDLKKSIEELPQGIADAVAKSIDRSLKT